MSKEVHISADIFCTWVNDNPMYRVYVDDHLLTERNYRWNNEHQYVREHIIVDIEPGTHSFYLETIGYDAKFTVGNFTVNGRPTQLSNHQFVVLE